MERNPDLAVFLTDDPTKLPTYGSAAQLEAAQAAQPAFTWMEWQTTLGESTSRLLMDEWRGGSPEPVVALRLQQIGDRMGLNPDDVLQRARAAWTAEGQ
jgi:hypothetical protein